MKKWRVSMSIKGTAVIEVKAENEDEAITQAVREIDNSDIEDWDVETKGADVQEITEDNK